MNTNLAIPETIIEDVEGIKGNESLRISGLRALYGINGHLLKRDYVFSLFEQVEAICNRVRADIHEPIRLIAPSGMMLIESSLRTMILGLREKAKKNKNLDYEQEANSAIDEYEKIMIRVREKLRVFL